jgi:hypothetical protein
MRTLSNLESYFNRFNISAELVNIGSDEFGVWLKNKAQYKLARSIAENLGFAVLQPFEYNYNRNAKFGGDMVVY